jgi:hypothetical protein
MCEISKSCRNEDTFAVNARYREAQIHCCAVHLSQAVREMSEFKDDRYPKRSGHNGVRVFAAPDKKKK